MKGNHWTKDCSIETEIILWYPSKVKVDGACRIWGTLHDCTAKSVKNVIARVCKVDGGVHVKCKVK